MLAIPSLQFRHVKILLPQAETSPPPANAEVQGAADATNTTATPAAVGQQTPTNHAAMYTAMQYPGYPPRGPQNQYYTAFHQHVTGVTQPQVPNHNSPVPGPEVISVTYLFIIIPDLQHV